MCLSMRMSGNGAGVHEEGVLPTISVSALVTDSESDPDISVVRERVNKGIFFFPLLFPSKIDCFVSIIGQIETKVSFKLDVYSSPLRVFWFTEVCRSQKTKSGPTQEGKSLFRTVNKQHAKNKTL